MRKLLFIMIAFVFIVGCQQTDRLITPEKGEKMYTLNRLQQEEDGSIIEYFAFEFLDIEEPMLVFNVNGSVVIYDEYFEEARKITRDEEPLFEYYRNLDGVSFQPIQVDETIYKAVQNCIK